jgi:two-component system chemotaxis response regulator CheB
MSIRTIVVDDTVTYRKIISDILSTLTEIELLGTAPTGSIALKKLAQTPADLVFLDVHMPEMDGVETLKKIRSQFPSVIVVMMSGISSRNTSDTIEALQNGAIDFIRKPDGIDHARNLTQLKNDITAVIRFFELKKNTGNIPNRKVDPAPIVTLPKSDIALPKIRISPTTSFVVCVIGISTGGPEALSKLIPQLPENFPLPILIVQHMPPFFTNSLAESLNKKSKLKVIEAPENAEITPGTVYIAPGGKHMVVRNNNGCMVIGHNDGPPENSCRPSVDVLFRSVASNYGDQGILALILTGMGNDGCSGVRTLKRKKSFCITQSESSCVVYGMPRAVDEAGLSDLSIPLDNIPLEMVNLTGKSYINTSDRSVSFTNKVDRFQ